MKYYSEKLTKVFDTEEELKKAEGEAAEAELKKAEESKVRKADASKVEEAYKARNEARKAYNEKLTELRAAYNEAMAQARKAFEEGVDKVGNELSAKEQGFKDELDAFYKAHGPYHLTLKDGDSEVTLTRTGSEFREYGNPLFDWNWFFDLVRRW